jgi:hypothetical protein
MAYPPQVPSQPPYGPAGYGYPPPRRTNVLAVISLVAGIASWVLVPLVGAVGAVVTGHIAMRQIRRTGEDGNGMAIAGLVLGYLNILFSLLMLAIFGTLIATCIAGIQNGSIPDPTNLPTGYPTSLPSDFPTDFPTSFPTAEPFPTS